MLNFTRGLLRLRREHPALQRGGFVLAGESRKHLAYLRRLAGETILVALNFSDRPLRIDLPRDLTAQSWKLLLSTHRAESPDLSTGGLDLQPYEACLLQTS